MRKELVVWVSTTEEGEEVKVQQVAADKDFIMLTLGQVKMVINVHELIDGIGAISHYAALFDQEQKMREMRDSARATPAAVVLPTVKAPKKAKVAKEDEGALVLEAQTRTGPTASEIALEKQMALMRGDSLVFKKDK